jgi:hypothetical protein
MVPGIIWSFTALLSIGVARASFAIEWNDKLRGEARLQRLHGFIVMTLLSRMAISSAIAFYFEQSAKINLSYRTLELIFVDTALLITTAITGTSLLVYSPISSVRDRPVNSTHLGSNFEARASFASSILVLVEILCSQPPTVVSCTQLFPTYSLPFAFYRQSKVTQTPSKPLVWLNKFPKCSIGMQVSERNAKSS